MAAKQGIGKTWRAFQAQARKRPRVFFSSIALIAMLASFPTLLGQGVGLDKSAEFYFISPANDHVAGGDFDFEVRVKTGGGTINALGLYLTYNPLYIEVLNMTTDKSFCTFYTENNFNNRFGTLQVACGAPNPGFRGDSVVVRVKARALIPGRTEIRVSDTRAQILANDGKGSNIMKSVPLPLIINTKQL